MYGTFSKNDDDELICDLQYYLGHVGGWVSVIRFQMISFDFVNWFTLPIGLCILSIPISLRIKHFLSGIKFPLPHFPIFLSLPSSFSLLSILFPVSLTLFPLLSSFYIISSFFPVFLNSFLTPHSLTLPSLFLLYLLLESPSFSSFFSFANNNDLKKITVLYPLSIERLEMNFFCLFLRRFLLAEEICSFVFV